jgi:hypothetical protein
VLQLTAVLIKTACTLQDIFITYGSNEPDGALLETLTIAHIIKNIPAVYRTQIVPYSVHKSPPPVPIPR